MLCTVSLLPLGKPEGSYLWCERQFLGPPDSQSNFRQLAVSVILSSVLVLRERTSCFTAVVASARRLSFQTVPDQTYHASGMFQCALQSQ